MSNIFTSSIGKKMIMSISGIILVLFLVFHMSMNLVAVFSADAYNAIAGFLGANWYALVASAALAGIVFIHFAFAIFLTWQNMRARGNKRYAVNGREQGVEWASKNMLVLGIIVICALVLHLFNFWSKMQLAELLGMHEVMLDGVAVSPADGAAFIRYTFSQWYYVVLYLIWFTALWFHLTHGIWSMLQSIGMSNKVWLRRIKVISTIFATLIIACFTAVLLVFFVRSLM